MVALLGVNVAIKFLSLGFFIDIGMPYYAMIYYDMMCHLLLHNAMLWSLCVSEWRNDLNSLSGKTTPAIFRGKTRVSYAKSKNKHFIFPKDNPRSLWTKTVQLQKIIFSQKLSVEKSLMEISQKCQDRAIKAELRAAAAEAATWLSFFGFTPFFWGGIVFDICIYSCIRCCTVLLKK